MTPLERDASVFKIHTMPSSTRRLSHRGRPFLGWGGSGGKNGSIFAHCSSVSRGRLRAIGQHPKPITIACQPEHV